jgi:hypothetical protein
MVAVAQDAQGATRVAPAVAGMRVEFPILIDAQSLVAHELGFRLVPAGVLLAADGTVVYASDDDFDVADPRLRANLEAFLAGRPVVQSSDARPMSRAALELFAQGARAHSQNQPEQAVVLWRRALELDPENFVIRSQIWAAEHPERFWPTVDRAWQERQLQKEGYEGPLP